MGSCIRCQRRIDDGTCVPRSTVCGTMCDGCWKDAVCMAANRPARAKLVDHNSEPQEAIAAAVQSAGSARRGLRRTLHFLRDLDFIETKLRSAGSKTSAAAEDGSEEKPDKPTKRPWPKKKGKNGKREAGRASRKLKRKMLFTMSSRSGTEVPDGGVMSQHGLQSSAGGQGFIQWGCYCKISCVDFRYQ